MHDIKFIRKYPEVFDAAMRIRGFDNMASKILAIDEEVRKKKTELQELQTLQNVISNSIGEIKSSGVVSNIVYAKISEHELIKEAESIKFKSQVIESEVAVNESKIKEFLVSLPNLPDSDVPFGKDENDNILIREYGAAKIFDFKPKQHFELGENLGQMDFQVAAMMSGSRFVLLKNDISQMQRALINFMIDIHTEHFGYTEISVPYLVSDAAMFNTGQLPKMDEESFKTTDGYRLIPTAEVPLTNIVANSILSEEKLPLRFVAYSPCFRSEAGSAGRDTRGMLRQHQFSKVELVSITRPQDSKEEHERMTSAAEEILNKLELPYRVMLLCSQDMGFAAQKTYDIEVWMPGQDCYREISSCSNCGDFQAIRMKARYHEYHSGENRFVHTLNGSGLPIGRTTIAIMENYQDMHGNISIPTVLQPYMHNKKVIEMVS
ncbi:serine--tRNA ligase [Candidatus Lariskella endosymbiont of Hedychridium roseum]|uniref:serine--tRNA ligase n=1 Tax=Candidatus Lariskella endosymbiont of Hedychridium roseum TaxID=3077949 RepID=UPI0030D48394